MSRAATAQRRPRRAHAGSALTVAFALSTFAAVAPSHAGVCSIDLAPAATLLLPYFEVDLAHPDGVTTLFSVDNAAAEAVLTNVTVWTDLGVPTLSFPVYLTGYDVQTVNVRDLLSGHLPTTGSTGQDEQDLASPKGPLSQDVDFASCDDFLPPAPLGAAAVADLRAAHTGTASTALGGCAGQDLGDGVARGYITIDTVSGCSATIRTPADAGYFAAGGSGRATDQNVLWGDWFLVDSTGNLAEGDDLVRIEAAPATFGDGDLTFYGRFVGDSGVDDREPLATIWSSRYAIGGGFDGGTDFVVWRDPEDLGSGFDCNGGRPSWYPLSQAGFAVFDEEENVAIPISCPFECPTITFLPFPAATNRVSVGSGELPVPFDFGWLYLDLKSAPLAAGEPMHSQSWVGTLMSAQGRYGVGFTATPLDSSCAPGDCTPGSGTCSE